MKKLKVLSIIVLLFLVASIIPAVHSSAQAAPAYINYTVQKGKRIKTLQKPLPLAKRPGVTLKNCRWIFPLMMKETSPEGP